MSYGAATHVKTKPQLLPNLQPPEGAQGEFWTYPGLTTGAKVCRLREAQNVGTRSFTLAHASRVKFENRG